MNKRIRPSRFRELFNNDTNGEAFKITKGPEDHFPSHPEVRYTLAERLAIFKDVKRRIAAARDGDKASEVHCDG